MAPGKQNPPLGDQSRMAVRDHMGLIEGSGDDLMGMTSEEKQLVRSTFAKAERISEIVGLAFYQHLFALDPSLRPLFRHDIHEQSKKLLATLKLVVDSLDQPEAIVPALEALGRRHLQYGTKDEHYDTLGIALLWTLEHALGNDFPPKARHAWAQVYAWVATTMREAAATAAASFDTTRFVAPSSPDAHKN